MVGARKLRIDDEGRAVPEDGGGCRQGRVQDEILNPPAMIFWLELYRAVVWVGFGTCKSGDSFVERDRTGTVDLQCRGELEREAAHEESK